MEQLSRADVEAAIRRHGSQAEAGKVLGKSRHQLRRILLAGPSSPLSDHALRRQVSSLKGEVRSLLELKHQNATYQDFVARVVARQRPAPEWVTRASKRGRKNPTIASIAISDLHHGEVVRPEEIEFANGFDTKISLARTKQAFESAVRLARDFTAGVDYDGIVVNLLGDNISGDIHDELAQTNEATAAECVLDVSAALTSGIRMLAEEFGRVLVIGVPGNHSRLTFKSHAKLRSKKNLDWLIYHLIARDLAADKRVSFNIGAGADVRYSVYGMTFLATHGDQFKGGSGISGLMAPLLLGDHRKRKRSAGIGRPYDVQVMGHWHQLTLGVSGIIINGSIKGYDEYAYTRNLSFEVPQQAFWLNDQEHGITMRAPIHVLGASESWRRSA